MLDHFTVTTVFDRTGAAASQLVATTTITGGGTSVRHVSVTYVGEGGPTAFDLGIATFEAIEKLEAMKKLTALKLASLDVGEPR